MKNILARFKVATPCFTGSTQDSAELRLPSIKGALRFWWRALAYAEYANEGNSNQTIRLMQERENRLFGSSKTGQSQVTMRLDTQSQPRILEKGEILCKGLGNAVGPGTRYLGYGVMEAFTSRLRDTVAGRLSRPCLAAPFEFSLRVAAKDEAPLRRVESALQLLGMVGGIGARSRKGYGSLSLISMKGDGIADWLPLETEEDYCDRLQSLLRTVARCDHTPQISAFSSHACVALLFKNKSPMDILEDYGKEMVRYRSWGRNGKILDGEPSQFRFPDDHCWMKGTEMPKDFHPRRMVFGLPHNYSKSIKVIPQNKKYDRRASPLFFHVGQIGAEYIGVALLLRSQFLPECEKISARNATVPANPDWSVLTKFLEKHTKRRIWPNG